MIATSSEDGDPVKTICPYCGVGCGTQIQQGQEPGDVQFLPWGDAPVNEGRICIKGGAATEVVAHEGRLIDPLIGEACGYVRLESRRGEIAVEAQAAEDTKEGVVWTTPHFAAVSVLKLTNHVSNSRTTSSTSGRRSRSTRSPRRRSK